ncbi:hypothetical protein BGW38_007148, partial [Lunasporangiospora selenospora]
EQAAAGPIRLAKIQFLTIFMGANDACLPGSVQHVDLDQYESNLRSLIDSVHDPTSPTYSPETKIILICPPMIDEPRWAMRRAGQGIPMDRATGLFFDQIMGIIRRKYPEWDPEVMPMHAPWWGELDRANPEQDLLICDNKVKPSV